METNWAYTNNKPMTQEHKDALELILKSFIQNINNVKEYHLDSHTDVEEVYTETLWKQFRPGKRRMDLKISVCIDGYYADGNYINPTEKEKNADTKKETHNIAPRAFTIFNGTKIVFAGEWELDNLKRNGYFSVDYIPATAKEYLQTLDDFFRKSIKEKITILLCATGKQYLLQVYLINSCFTDHLGWLSVKYGFAVSGDIVEL